MVAVAGGVVVEAVGQEGVEVAVVGTGLVPAAEGGVRGGTAQGMSGRRALAAAGLEVVVVTAAAVAATGPCAVSTHRWTQVGFDVAG